MEAAETDTFLLGDRVIMHNAFEANILLKYIQLILIAIQMTGFYMSRILDLMS